MALMNVIKKACQQAMCTRPPRLLAVPHEGAAQKGVSQECTMCFFKYLHLSDPDVNHADLLTSLLIVCCFFPILLLCCVVLFTLCVPYSSRRTGVRLFLPRLGACVCFASMFVLTGCCPSRRTNANLINWL